MQTVTLEYRRDCFADTSTGRVVHRSGFTEFTTLPFRAMLRLLCGTLAQLETKDIEVTLQRTDRAGLLPYRLDNATVQLLVDDPIAGIQAMEYASPSPSTIAQRIREERNPPTTLGVTAGLDALADAFGDTIMFRVRGQELECPGCGFWGGYVAGSTRFSCHKKCQHSFVVRCARTWGYIRVEHLLEMDLDRFFFPRVWNQGQSWVSREELQKKYAEYLYEKGQLHV